MISATALTIYQLLLTALVELGLGFCAIGIALYIPKIKGFRRTVFWAIGLVITLSIGLDLITSSGWQLSKGIIWNFIYATANNQPNGAHITSYLSVIFIALFVWIKTKDIFLGGLFGAFLVAVHEGIWIVFYYSAYGRYLVFPEMDTNFLKDFPIFTGMLILFVVAFYLYRSQLWHNHNANTFNPYSLKDFKYVYLFFVIYMLAWFFIPHLIDPSYYGYLPIRTANLPSEFTAITSTQFNETKYFYDPVTNLIEVFSWLALCAGMCIVVWIKKLPIEIEKRSIYSQIDLS